MPLLSSEINILEKVCSKASKVIIRDFGEIEKLQVSKKALAILLPRQIRKLKKLLSKN